MLDLHRLRVLRTVVDHGSVSGAAAALNYTPSAVSQHMAALERETGIALLERSGRGVRPTPAGLLLAEHAGAVLTRLHEAEEALADLRTGRTGRLVLAAFPSAGSGLVPEAVERFRGEFPDVSLDLQIAEGEEAEAALRVGSVDVAVVMSSLDLVVPQDGLVRERLLDDPFHVVLPRGHRLAARRSIPLAELADEPWISAVACAPYCQVEATAACAAAGFTQRFVVEADDYPAVLSYVALGAGVALVPRLALGATPPGALLRPVKGRAPARRIWSLTRPALAGSGAVPGMLRALREVAATR